MSFAVSAQLQLDSKDYDALKRAFGPHVRLPPPPDAESHEKLVILLAPDVLEALGGLAELKRVVGQLDGTVRELEEGQQALAARQALAADTLWLGNSHAKALTRLPVAANKEQLEKLASPGRLLATRKRAYEAAIEAVTALRQPARASTAAALCAVLNEVRQVKDLLDNPGVYQLVLQVAGDELVVNPHPADGKGAALRSAITEWAAAGGVKVANGQSR